MYKAPRLCILALTFAVAFILTCTPQQQSRAETDLFFSPTRLNIDNTRPVQEIRVTNMSSIARAYSISLVNLAMTEKGQTTQVDTFDYSAKRMIRFVPRNFTIKPGEKQIIRIMARFPKDTKDGEYHAHLQFLENISKRMEINPDIKDTENKARIAAQLSYTTAIPITIAKGEIKTDISMSDHAFKKDEKSGAPLIAMMLNRSGNGQGIALIEADYIAPNGTEKKAAVRRTAFIYRELDKRHYNLKLELIEEEDLQKGGEIRVKLYNKDTSEDEPVDTILLPISE